MSDKFLSIVNDFQHLQYMHEHYMREMISPLNDLDAAYIEIYEIILSYNYVHKYRKKLLIDFLENFDLAQINSDYKPVGKTPFIDKLKAAKESIIQGIQDEKIGLTTLTFLD